MELPLQPIARTLEKAVRDGVSILVLMELPLQQVFRIPRSFSFIGFNPCFNGTTSATKEHPEINFMDYDVSILVLMELPLQRYLCSICIYISKKSFNPCFNGTTSATEISGLSVPSISKFQSLF